MTTRDTTPDAPGTLPSREDPGASGAPEGGKPGAARGCTEIAPPAAPSTSELVLPPGACPIQKQESGPAIARPRPAGAVARAADALARYRAAEQAIVDPPDRRRVGRKQDPTHTLADLSRMETRVFLGLAAGMTGAELAVLFNVSKKTIDTHRLHVIRKLRIRNAADMARVAIEDGVLPNARYQRLLDLVTRARPLLQRAEYALEDGGDSAGADALSTLLADLPDGGTL